MRRTCSIAILTFREAIHNKVLLSCAFFAVALVLIRLAVFASGGPSETALTEQQGVAEREGMRPAADEQKIRAREKALREREFQIKVEQFTRIALILTLLTGVVVTVVVVSPSLSQDIRSKVIHTVIPKPIHRVEILLGKVLGFAATAALILLVIGVITFALVRLTVGGQSEEGLRRNLAAEVRVPATSIRFSGGCIPYMKRSNRRWINPYVRKEDLPPPEELKLSPIKFAPGEAIVTFDRVTPRDLGGEPLRFELRLGVHRYGGAAGEDPELGVVILNRQTGDRRIQGRSGPEDTQRQPFIIRENVPRRIMVPAEFIGQGATVDLIIHNLTPKHRVGIERTDVVLLLADRSYTANFVKSMLVLFLEIFLVVVVAVMSSTFLTGLIAILFTGVVWMSGHLLGWVSGMLLRWETSGRGPLVEMTHEFEYGQFTPQGPLDWVVDFTNSIFKGVLVLVAHLFPNLGEFDSAWLLARNVDISAAVVWRAAQFSLLYSAICFVIAYACFRVKEVAR